jgi:hypothetical protein
MILKTFASMLISGAVATPDVAFRSLGTFELKNAAFPAVTAF